MKSKGFRSAAAIATLLLAMASIAFAQGTPSKFRGLINDYTPPTAPSGPWEIRGQWQLLVNWNTAKANFSAALTMERSDAGVELSAGGDFTSVGRHPHTHHVMLGNGDVTPLTDANGNPIGFRVIGVATIAGNGGAPPDFEPSSTVQIDIIGGSIVKFSNLKLSFIPGGPCTVCASGHFGTQPFNGVVWNGD